MRAYRKPSWMLRVVGNRMSPMNRRLISTLSVPGRRSGRWRTTPVVVMEYDGERYLVAAFGETEWALNLRAAGRGRLQRRGSPAEEFTAAEVPVPERGPLIEEYRRRYSKAPGVAASFKQFPDPANHPTFRVTPS
jgi:deazaflavin-dependent oxidoreductase (nitroreductase family)